jgi:hypothetical protein
MIRRIVVLGIIVGALVAESARGEELTLGLHDVTVIQDGHGSGRVLFRTGALPASDRLLVESAVLTVPYAGASEDRSLELRVCPVTAVWTGGDWNTPFDEEIYARSALVGRAPGALSFDLTVAFKAMREHGLYADGFVVTVADRERGVALQDLARVSELGGASLQVTTMNLPSGPPPRRWRERHGG